jgi:hypothetical protein
MCCDYGCVSFGGVVNGAAGRGTASWTDSEFSSLRSAFYILIPASALPPRIQGRNRVRQSRQHGSVRGCVKNVLRHDAVSKMKGGPSESACRSRLQTAVSCWSRKAAGGERYGKGAARLHQVRVKETSANELLMRHRNRSTEGIKNGAPPLSREEHGGNLLIGHAVSGVQAA